MRSWSAGGHPTRAYDFRAEDVVARSASWKAISARRQSVADEPPRRSRDVTDTGIAVPHARSPPCSPVRARP